jgi:hypothetical protein
VSARRAAARRLTGGARSSVISELKFTPKENYPKINIWGLKKILEKFMEVGN